MEKSFTLLLHQQIKREAIIKSIFPQPVATGVIYHDRQDVFDKFCHLIEDLSIANLDTKTDLIELT